MLTGWEEDSRPPTNTEPQRVLLVPGEYPGTPPRPEEVKLAESLRQQGNIAYADGKYEDAVRLYSNAAALNPCDHLVYSHRSACLLRVGRLVEALDDADLCVSIAPTFARGLLRKGTAEQLLGRRVDARSSFMRGLDHDPDSGALKKALEGLRSETSGGLQATLYHVLFVSPNLQMDRLFQVLEDPDRLTAAYVQENQTELDAQFACLTQTLRIDLGLLLASPVLRDAYDRVTFACGQILQWAPEAVTKHMVQATRIVQGLGLALRCGWRIHHGVAKFSANALAVLATCEGAQDNLRREAVRLLLGGLHRWLLDPTPEPENPPEDRDVCGCAFLSPRLSSATWLERLFEHGTKAWVREECENFSGILQLVSHLCLVVRDEKAVPLGLPCLLRLPKVASAAMRCSAHVDLTTCNRDAFGRREGRRWLTRQRGKNSASGGNASEAAVSPTTPPLSPGKPGTSPTTAVPAAASSCQEPGQPSSQREPNSVASLPSNTSPSQRLGEWLMASLGYLLVFVDDDALFAAHACSALSRLAHAVPDGVARLTEGVWMGLPLLERLSTLACQHTAALELMETLARHSPTARCAMQSLAAALASASPSGGVLPPPPSQLQIQPQLPADTSEAGGLVAAEGDDEVRPMAVDTPRSLRSPVSSNEMEVQAMGSDLGPMSDIAKDEHETPMKAPVSEPKSATTNEGGQSASNGEAASTVGGIRTATQEQGREHESEHEGLGEPSWVDCYHELHDELWVSEDPSCADARNKANVTEIVPATPRCHGVVSLGNFPEVALQVPVTGRFAIRRTVSGSETVREMTAVPSVWNPRFKDLVQAPLIIDSPIVDLGTPGWLVGKEGTIVLLMRSAIQRSPATQDWASSVWLCAEAGAKAAVVVNDMPDDGPVQVAFRMGLFGSPAPPVPAFMISGSDGILLREAAERAAPTLLNVAIGSVEAQSVPILSNRPEGALAKLPAWPLVLRVPQDVAQSWSLMETVFRAAPNPEFAASLDALAQRMGLPEKRVWLTRRLQRYHRGDTDSDEPMEPQLAFLECDREGDHLQQIRKQYVEKTGLAAPDITGEFEVRFRDESSVGSAVVREWMDLVAKQAFLAVGHKLLISYDGGVSFLPDPAAPFVNPQWQSDFELLGRLLGLALWHQVTLDLPIHTYVCEMLIHSSFSSSSSGEDEDADMDSGDCDGLLEDGEKLRSIDPELYQHKVLWLLRNDVEDLGFEMPFTDVLLDAACGSSSSSSSAPKVKPDDDDPDGMIFPDLTEMVRPEDTLAGDVTSSKTMRFRRWPASGVLVSLISNGESTQVTELNKTFFVKKLLDWRLRGSLRGPVAAMVRGLRAVVPSPVLEEARRMLTPSQVHGLLAGMREIDVNDWQRNTRMAGGLTANTQEVQWFWGLVHTWAADGRQDRLQDLLQFATGSRRVPVGGFAQLVGFNGGKHLFTLARGAHLSENSLPTSHACICTLDLPPWRGKEAAWQKFCAALEAGKARFDEGHATGARGTGNE